MLHLAENPLRRLRGKGCRGGAIRPALPRHEVERLGAVVAADGLVGLADEVHGVATQPVIAAGVLRLVVHALLDDGPLPLAVEQEHVVVELIAVLYGGAVHLGGHAARIDEGFGIHAQVIAVRQDLPGCRPRHPPLAPADKEADFMLHAPDAFLDRPAGRRGEAAGVPVEPEGAAQGLEPEGVREPPEQFLGPVFIKNHEDDLPGKELHPAEEPGGRFPAMKRKVCDAGLQP